MGRPKKSVAARRAAEAKKNSPALKGTQTVVDGVARVKAFYELDLNSYSDAYLTMSGHAGAQFTEWLASIDLSLDALAEVADRHTGQPVMCELVVARWIETKVEGVQAPKMLKDYVSRLALWLRRNGWDASRLDGRSTSGEKLRNGIDSMCAAKPKHIKTQSRPYSSAEMDRIVAAIDANTFDWNDLTVQAMRTYSVLGFAMAMRGGELCHTLRWNMVDVDNEVFNLPGGRVFKHQNEPSTLQVPHNHCLIEACGPNCPVGVLKAWKKTCEEHGIPTIDTLVFPAIRQKAAWNKWATAELFGDKSFIADPVAHNIDLKGDSPKTRTSARGRQSSRYRILWGQACEAAGIQADHQWERISLHGMRSGSATTAVRNGVSVVAVSIRLRHGDIETTSIYVRRQAADTTGLKFISPTQNEELANTETVDADALRKTCEVTHNGVACGRDFEQHIDIDGEKVPACDGHRGRKHAGKTGDELTQPIGYRHMHDGKCEVTHNGVPCGRDYYATKDIAGERVPVCSAHWKRLRKDKTGDDLTKPIKTRKAA